MIPVLHFCSKDADLMVKNLEWWIHLDGKVDFHAILSHDDATPAHQVQAVKRLADQYFRSVEVFWYPQPRKTSWPAAPNWAWQNTARYIAATKNESWFWIEADVVAIRKGWLKDIWEDHQKNGKPFSGHIVGTTVSGHVNGVAVYPPNVAQYSVDAFRTEESAWDVVLGKDLSLDGEIKRHVNWSEHLFQHCWAINPATGVAWNGTGELATFKNTHDVVRLVSLAAAIFHRCKDGTLIDMLKLHYAHPELAMVPQHTATNEKDGSKIKEKNDGSISDSIGLGIGADNNSGVLGELRCSGSGGKITALQPDQSEKQKEDNQTASLSGVSEINENEPIQQVPAVATPEPAPAEPIQEVQAADDKPEPVPFTGVCEILIVTYGLPTKRVSGLVVSDFDWLKWCLRCIRKHCTGFAGITVAFPDRDAQMFAEISKEHAQAKSGIPLRLQMYKEEDGKGHIQHMSVMGRADHIVPDETTHVLHVDADVMFDEPITPSEYFHGDKPVYVVRTWESLFSKDRKTVSDCFQWKAPTDAQLGIDSEIYGMCRHPTGFPIDFYQTYRDHLKGVHGKPFVPYMMEGGVTDGWRPNRMDFTAMGAFAWAKMRDRFHWIDISAGNHLAPKDKQSCFWSHGGVTPEIQKDIEGFLK